MFTGIITDIGQLRERRRGKMRISCAYDPATIELGASIACDGCCLTVTMVDPDKDGAVFDVDVSNETLSCTTLGGWQQGRRINLERALKIGEELGGHIVTGHVDALARIVNRRQDGDAVRFTLEVPATLSKYIAPKGSIALNGTSLTVNEVDGNRFGISLIPHSLKDTTWDERAVGDEINLEVDLMARYVARMRDVEKLEN